MLTVLGSKQWTIKYNQYIICDLIFFLSSLYLWWP